MSCTQPIRNENDLNKFRNYYRTIEDKPRNYALIEFGLNSALRISDILALHWNDVYLTSTHKYRDHILVKEQKTGKENVIITKGLKAGDQVVSAGATRLVEGQQVKVLTD